MDLLFKTNIILLNLMTGYLEYCFVQHYEPNKQKETYRFVNIDNKRCAFNTCLQIVRKMMPKMFHGLGLKKCCAKNAFINEEKLQQIYENIMSINIPDNECDDNSVATNMLKFLSYYKKEIKILGYAKILSMSKKDLLVKLEKYIYRYLSCDYKGIDVYHIVYCGKNKIIIDDNVYTRINDTSSYTSDVINPV